MSYVILICLVLVWCGRFISCITSPQIDPRQVHVLESMIDQLKGLALCIYTLSKDRKSYLQGCSSYRCSSLKLQRSLGTCVTEVCQSSKRSFKHTYLSHLTCLSPLALLIISTIPITSRPWRRCVVATQATPPHYLGRPHHYRQQWSCYLWRRWC